MHLIRTVDKGELDVEEVTQEEFERACGRIWAK
jgi:hypothetical protein